MIISEPARSMVKMGACACQLKNVIFGLQEIILSILDIVDNSYDRDKERIINVYKLVE